MAARPPSGTSRLATANATADCSYDTLQLTNRPTMLRAVVLVCTLAVARACEVCVAGVCQQRIDLLRGFQVTDRLALDRDSLSRALYVQINHLFARPFDFHLQIANVDGVTSGLAVDPAARALYAAENTTLYSSSPDEDYSLVEIHPGLYAEPDLMIYKDKLYYTIKLSPGLYYIENESSIRLIDLDAYTITDFVINKNNRIYFVSDNKFYVYHENWSHAELIANKSYALSVDKSGDVYLGDSTQNGIYKLDESDTMVAYAAYTGDSVNRFVFDHQDNIVFYDPVKRVVSYWKPVGTPCAVEPPRATFSIKNISLNLCNQTQDAELTATETDLDKVGYQ